MFTINGETWDVLFLPPDNRIFRQRKGTYTIGACDDITKTIYLANTLRGAQLKKVLCHEIVHSSMFSNNVELEYMQEEVIADIISTYGEEIITITENLMRGLN